LNKYTICFLGFIGYLALNVNENIIEGSIAVGCDASLDKQFAG